MLKAIGVMLMCLGTLPVFSQSGADYQGAAVIDVVTHQATGPDASRPSYDVSLLIGDTVYVVLYTPPLGLDTTKYQVGQQLTALVGERTITFNDVLGNSSDVPILSRTTKGKQKSTSSDPPTGKAPIKSTELVGLVGVKENTVGTVAVESGKLQFVHSQGTADISTAVMEDVVTSDDSQEVIRGTLGTLSMFGPYGSGRALSLAGSTLDSLTIEYRDTDGGLHGVVFTMPSGTAESVKQELIAHGAHTRIATPANPTVDPSHSANLEQKP